MIALGVGAFWALAFEYPGVNVEQAIFNHDRNKRQPRGKENALRRIPKINHVVTERS